MDTDTQPSSPTSPATLRLFGALAEAQLHFTPIIKTCTNKYTKQRYADLSSVLAAVQAPLLAQGLFLTHELKTEWNDDLSEGFVTVTTHLVHAPSGERLSGVITLPVLPMPRRREDSGEEQDFRGGRINAQAFGIAITYGRRYGVCALLGVAPDEDSDGEPEAAGGTRTSAAVARAVAKAAESKPATRTSSSSSTNARVPATPKPEQLRALSAEDLETAIQKGEETLAATAPEDPRRARMQERLEAYRGEKDLRFRAAFDQRTPGAAETTTA